MKLNRFFRYVVYSPNRLDDPLVVAKDVPKLGINVIELKIVLKFSCFNFYWLLLFFKNVVYLFQYQIVIARQMFVFCNTLHLHKWPAALFIEPAWINVDNNFFFLQFTWMWACRTAWVVALCLHILRESLRRCPHDS